MLVPPGHAVSSVATQFCKDVGIKFVATGSRYETISAGELTLLSDQEFDVLHTRDLVMDLQQSLQHITTNKQKFKRPDW